MNEDFLQFVWKYKLFDEDTLITKEGEPVTVLDTGIHNRDSGPDFFNSRVKIGETTWAGNVEIHLKASDWFRHGHHKDKAYNSIVLQVVLDADKEILRDGKEVIPTAEIKFDKRYLLKYNHLIQNKTWIACENEIDKLEEFVKAHWLTVLTIERLKRKTDQIRQMFAANNNNWEETFYQHIARNFGLKANSDPFEWLAKSLPLKILAKHKNNNLQIEALLFGQGGFLEEEILDTYFKELKKEYQFLRTKYELKPIEKHLWKFMRLRPSNFPTIRIAQLANLIFKSFGLFSKTIAAETFREIEQLFDVECSEYWLDHYMFGKPSKKRAKTLGKSAINTIIINTVVPFLFFYGEMKGEEKHKDKAVGFLEALPPEKNSIVDKWETLGFVNENSYISQALLQLKNEYCNKKKCLDCQIGNYIISKC